MKKLKDWKVKRSGASMTVTGTDMASGDQVKIVNVAEVSSGIADVGVFATIEGGECVELVAVGGE